MRIPGNCIAQTAACFSILKKSTQVPVSMAAYGNQQMVLTEVKTSAVVLVCILKEEYIKSVTSSFGKIFLETLG